MKVIILFLLLFGIRYSLSAQVKDTAKVYVFNIDEEIAPPVVRRMKNAFKEARQDHSDLIVIHMNTYGGMLASADTIRTRILNSKIPVVVFIDNNAASAGALISIACDSIYMRKGANIGAATVVNQNAQALPDKYQSYMRSTMRSTAEAKGRNPHIAEAMVDQDIYIKGISDSGKVLTFTTSEAIKNGFCEGQVSSIDGLLKHYGIKHYKVKTQQLKASDTFIDFLISPYVHGILIMIIVAGIYFELQTPGLGFPSIAALTAAILYFAPLYVEGLAENWELMAFFIGIVLIVLEIFVIPGFGVAGISGIILVVAALVLSLLNNNALDFSMVSFQSVLEATFVVVIALFGAIVISYFGIKYLLTNPRVGISLMKQNASSDGYIAVNPHYENIIGKQGVANTLLRPAGKIEVEDAIYDAVAEESFIEKGQHIEVISYYNNQFVVRKVE